MQERSNKANRWLDLGCLLFSLSLALYLGADLNWDLLNYHLYAPHLLLSRELNQDFLAASMQGYFNAVPYIPLYALVRLGASSTCVALVLAALQSGSLMLVHRIADQLLSPDAKHRLGLRIIATALAGCSAIYWVEIGSSLADVLVAIPVLAAALLWLRGIAQAEGEDRSAAARTAWIAGWLGVAIGLKPTAVVWIVPLLGYQVLRSPSRHGFVKTAATAGVSLLFGFLLVDGWWAWQLWKEYGNPVFPLMNGLFHSPDAAEGVLQHRRFIPASFMDALARPWQMLLLTRGAYLEKHGLDVRPFVFFLALGAWLCMALLRRRKQNALPSPLMAARWLIAALVIEWLCWLYLSGNGRYAAPMWLLMGPGLLAIWLLISHDTRWLTFGLGGVLALQLCSNLIGGIERWDVSPYQARYTEVEVPAEWREKPSLFLSLQNQSLAFLSMQVHPDSGFVNLIGQMPLGPGEPGWSRVEGLLERHGGSFRTLYVGTGSLGDDPASLIRRAIRIQKTLLLPFGFELDDQHCTYFKLWRNQPEGAGDDISLSNLKAWVLSCPGRKMDATRLEMRQAFLPALASANKVFDSMEQRCSGMHHGMKSTTRYFGELYVRQYVNTDITLMIQGDTAGMHAFNFRGNVGVPRECAEEGSLDALIQQHKQWSSSKAFTELLGPQ